MRVALPAIPNHHLCSKVCLYTTRKDVMHKVVKTAGVEVSTMQDIRTPNAPFCVFCLVRGVVDDFGGSIFYPQLILIENRFPCKPPTSE